MDLEIVMSGPGNADANMAADRRLIDEVGAEPGRAVLRWYTWEPAAFSLGYGQRPGEIFDLAKLRRSGTAWVKRPTGGSLVYHQGDVSYAFTLPRVNPWGIDSSRDLYRFVGAAWLRGFDMLGVRAELPRRVPSARTVPPRVRRVCLGFHSPGDILVAGRKIGGGAQRRLRGVWLQQGFFLLRPFEPPDCFRDPMTAAVMRRSSGDLAACGHAIDVSAFCRCLTEAMQLVFRGAPAEKA